MLKKVELIKKEFEEISSSIIDLKKLNDIRVEYLGKQGKVTELSKLMKDVPNELKKEFGMAVNEVRNLVTNTLDTLKKELEEKALNEKLESEKIDITLPSKRIRKGSKHPMSLTIERVEDLFVSMGYDVVSGPELETDEYCFERLNLPKNHPARDMQDSFYIDEEHLLRTQTSSVQARFMMEQTEKKPIRIIVPGKTYRRDDDASHSPQFCQIEGLVIDKKDKNVSLADLKGTLEVFARTMLGSDLDIRFRPS